MMFVITITIQLIPGEYHADDFVWIWQLQCLWNTWHRHLEALSKKRDMGTVGENVQRTGIGCSCCPILRLHCSLNGSHSHRLTHFQSQGAKIADYNAMAELKWIKYAYQNCQIFWAVVAHVLWKHPYHQLKTQYDGDWKQLVALFPVWKVWTPRPASGPSFMTTSFYRFCTIHFWYRQTDAIHSPRHRPPWCAQAQTCFQSPSNWIFTRQ